MVISVRLQSQSHLVQVILACNGVSAGFGQRQGRQQQGGQNANDGDHHKQLHQREPFFSAAITSHIGLDSSEGCDSRSAEQYEFAEGREQSMVSPSAFVTYE